MSFVNELRMNGIANVTNIEEHYSSSSSSSSDDEGNERRNGNEFFYPDSTFSHRSNPRKKTDDSRTSSRLKEASSRKRPGFRRSPGVAPSKRDCIRETLDEKELQDLRLKVNSRERKRMHDLNSALDSLREVMPYAHGPSVRKLSKIATLLLAKNYILMLNSSLEEMKKLIPECYRGSVGRNTLSSSGAVPVPSAITTPSALPSRLNISPVLHNASGAPSSPLELGISSSSSSFPQRSSPVMVSSRDSTVFPGPDRSIGGRLPLHGLWQPAVGAVGGHVPCACVQCLALATVKSSLLPPSRAPQPPAHFPLVPPPICSLAAELNKRVIASLSPATNTT